MSTLSGGSERRLSPALSLAAVVMRTNGFLEAEIDKEIVALSIEHGTCYGLNRVGSRIWNLLASPAQIGDLLQRCLRNTRSILTFANVKCSICSRSFAPKA